MGTKCLVILLVSFLGGECLVPVNSYSVSWPAIIPLFFNLNLSLSPPFSPNQPPLQRVPRNGKKSIPFLVFCTSLTLKLRSPSLPGTMPSLVVPESIITVEW